MAGPCLVAFASESPAGAAKVTPLPPTLSIFAGTGNGGTPTAGPATSSDLNLPCGVAVDSSGNVYIADLVNNLVEKVTPTGTLSIIAGTGNPGTPTEGPATSSDLQYPQGVAVDSSGNVYIADTSNNLVEKVTPSGTLSIIAGTGNRGAPTEGPATSSDLWSTQGVAVDSSGNVYIADYGNSLIEKVTPGGTLSIIAGNGNFDPPTAGPATSSALYGPAGVAVDSSGNVYIADTGNNLVEKVTPGGTLSIIAGTGHYGTPTAGPATSSDLNSSIGVAVDSSGNVYIGDAGNNLVEKVTPTGTLSIIAGTGNPGTPTAGPATSSDLNYPGGVAVDSSGNVYIADGLNNLVEKVVAPRLAITTPVLVPATATFGQAYSTSFQTSGAAGATTWQRSSGSWPQGLKLNRTTGVLSGTISRHRNLPASSTYTFTIKATDAAKGTASMTYTLTVTP